MSLTLTVDGPRWRSHLERVAAATPGLVPVAKGNGYGLTIGRLARRATWLQDRGHDVTTLAVGTYDELDDVHQRWPGDLLVLTPWRPWVSPLPTALLHRVIHTVSRLDDLHALLAVDPAARIVLEPMTSMQRHGLGTTALWEAGAALRRHPSARVEGLTVHLPLGQGSHLAEVRSLITDAIAADAGLTTIWVSHLSEAELTELRASYPDFTFRPRIGTSLWLGDREALRVTARVLDVHPLRRGERYGYRGRRAPRSGHLVIASGGTAHGLGLSAPTGDQSLRSRATTIARGSLDAFGMVRSPYLIDGQQPLFAEPPHMQASMLFLLAGARVPDVGELLDVRVRYTATQFDQILISG